MVAAPNLTVYLFEHDHGCRPHGGSGSVRAFHFAALHLQHVELDSSSSTTNTAIIIIIISNFFFFFFLSDDDEIHGVVLGLTVPIPPTCGSHSLEQKGRGMLLLHCQFLPWLFLFGCDCCCAVVAVVDLVQGSK